VTTTAMVRDRQLLLRAAAPAGAQGQGAGSGAAAAAAAGCVADDAIDDNIHARRPVTVSSAAVDRLMNPLSRSIVCSQKPQQENCTISICLLR
jgi:hypothetical protein